MHTTLKKHRVVKTF